MSSERGRFEATDIMAAYARDDVSWATPLMKERSLAWILAKRVGIRLPMRSQSLREQIRSERNLLAKAVRLSRRHQLKMTEIEEMAGAIAVLTEALGVLDEAAGARNAAVPGSNGSGQAVAVAVATEIAQMAHAASIEANARRFRRLAERLVAKSEADREAKVVETAARMAEVEAQRLRLLWPPRD